MLTAEPAATVAVAVEFATVTAVERIVPASPARRTAPEFAANATGRPMYRPQPTAPRTRPGPAAKPPVGCIRPGSLAVSALELPPSAARPATCGCIGVAGGAAANRRSAPSDGIVTERSLVNSSGCGAGGWGASDWGTPGWGAGCCGTAANAGLAGAVIGGCAARPSASRRSRRHLRRRNRIAGIIGRRGSRCDRACRRRRHAVGRHERIRRGHLLIRTAGRTENQQDSQREHCAASVRMRPFHPRHPFPGASCAAARSQVFLVNWAGKLSKSTQCVQSVLTRRKRTLR